MSNDLLWKIFLAVGTALGIVGAFITNPADYGLTAIHLNWIRLVAVVMAGVGGALGHKINVSKVYTSLVGGNDAAKK